MYVEEWIFVENGYGMACACVCLSLINVTNNENNRRQNNHLPSIGYDEM